MNAKRSDLPKNEDADDWREVMREAMIIYLRDKTTRDERKDILKEAFSEWIDSKFAKFGWWSLERLVVLMFIAFISIWLYVNGWNKP